MGTNTSQLRFLFSERPIGCQFGQGGIDTFGRGEQRLRVLSGVLGHQDTRRSHMVRGHLPPVREKPEEVIQIDRDQVVVRSYVGGLVKSFERRAA